MGCCFTKPKRAEEHELSSSTNAAVTCKSGPAGDRVSVHHNDVNNSYDVKGHGTYLGSCALDCDCARWEVVVEDPTAVTIGVKRFNKKAPTDLSSTLDTYQDDKVSPSWIMKDIDVKGGDVVGVYWDQTDLPMLSFTLNGSIVHQASINRVRPSNDVFPAVSVTGNGKCTVIFDENHFKFPSIASKFKMIICSQSII